MNINELKYGQTKELNVLVKNVEEMTAANGASFQKIRVRDNAGNEATFMRFNEPLRIFPGKVYKMLVETKEYKASLSYLALQAETAGNVNVTAYLPKSKINPLKVWNEIVNTTNGLRFTIRKIIGGILTDNKSEFITLPLPGDGAFSRDAGIMEATHKLLRIAAKVSSEMDLDKDLLLGGAILYYIGGLKCVDEMYNPLPEEALLGSGTIASDMILTQAGKLDKNEEEYREEDVTLLRHVISARFRGLDPVVPEAIVLRYLDSMIVKTEHMSEYISGLKEGEIRKDGKFYRYRQTSLSPADEGADTQTD